MRARVFCCDLQAKYSVKVGHAVYIYLSGPNPSMVQVC